VHTVETEKGSGQVRYDVAEIGKLIVLSGHTLLGCSRLFDDVAFFLGGFFGFDALAGFLAMLA
jgi:hypothetical protein